MPLQIDPTYPDIATDVQLCEHLQEWLRREKLEVDRIVECKNLDDLSGLLEDMITDFLYMSDKLNILIQDVDAGAIKLIF